MRSDACIISRARAGRAALSPCSWSSAVSTRASLPRLSRSDKKKHIITTTTEHKCVLDSCRSLEQDGFRVTYLPVSRNGLVDCAALEAAITPETALVSIMGVNNEIGVMQPLAEIGKLCRKHKVFFHTDAAQMAGKVPLNVDESNIDLMSISGHKLCVKVACVCCVGGGPRHRECMPARRPCLPAPPTNTAASPIL